MLDMNANASDVFRIQGVYVHSQIACSRDSYSISARVAIAKLHKIWETTR